MNVDSSEDIPKDNASQAVSSIDTWWQRSDLQFRDGRLFLGQCDLDRLARKTGTPAYVIRLPRVLEKLKQLHSALDQADLSHHIYYAIKANRSSKLLTYLASQRLCGAVVC